MHFKAGLLAAVAATSALASETTGQNQIQIHRQFNLENGQTCVTKQPIQGCQAGFQPVYEQENQRSVEMYCLDNAHPMANQMAHIMETGHRLRALQQEAEKRTQRVPKIERCQTARLTKDGEIQERRANGEQRFDNQQSGLRSFQNKYNRSGKQQFETKEEQKQHFQTIRRDQQEKLQQLQKLMPSIEKATQLSEGDYEEAYKLIKHIARQDEQVEGALYMLQNSLPHQYVQAVQRIQKELEKDLTKYERMEESEKTREAVEQVHQQLKKLASRTYLYTLAQIVKEQQKQTISEQMENSYNNNWEQFEQHFERLWNKVKRDMDNEKIVEQIERQVERRFKKQIAEEEKQQLKAWQLNLKSKDDREQQPKHKQSWEEQQQQQQQQQPKEWETQMTRQQRERQQIQLTKIVLASLFKTAEHEKMTKEQEKSGSPLFSGLFSKKQHYEQLIKQVQNQFQSNNQFQSGNQYQSGSQY